jgi:CBS domain containing-hemolysin-like protein
VTEGDQLDNILGQVLRREVYDVLLLDPDTDIKLRDLMHPIRFVPESMPAHELLGHFVVGRSHMVAVTDEYGGFEGVVTLEDVLERMLGAEIVDEHDEIANLRSFARERAAGLADQREPGSDDGAETP